MEIIWTDHVKNEVVRRVKEQRNIIGKMKRGNTKRIYHSLCRNCPLKDVIEGKVERRSDEKTRKKK
jgi:predicted RNA-binding protein with PUA-like domain